jgi:phosphoribosyl 1,2-cyclic phosphate phosphodiesterase
MKEGDRIQLGNIPVTALQVMHGKLPILGFRIGDLGYITDMTDITPRSRELLKGIKILVVNGLRHEPHPTHQTVEDAVEFSRSIAPDLPTYIIHMSHHLGLHATEDALLPAHIHLAYDGLTLEF